MKYKILITDDDHDFVKVLEERLELAGYETISAHEGVRAVERAHKDKPDLIILDWKMPTGKGPSVMRFLTEEEETKHIPIIILTGVDEPGMEEFAKSHGAKAFLRKPYDPKQLLKTIKEVLEWEKVRNSIHEDK